jgi:hypothetical protein
MKMRNANMPSIDEVSFKVVYAVARSTIETTPKVIVKLGVPQNAKTTFDRKVFDPKYASYNVSSALVLAIEDVDGIYLSEKVNGVCFSNREYRVGCVVEDPNFDSISGYSYENTNICVFLTREAANRYLKYSSSDKTPELRNGALLYNHDYDGFLCNTDSYNYKGELLESTRYFDRTDPHGSYCTSLFYPSGILQLKYTYVNYRMTTRSEYDEEGCRHGLQIRDGFESNFFHGIDISHVGTVLKWTVLGVSSACLYLKLRSCP